MAAPTPAAAAVPCNSAAAPGAPLKPLASVPVSGQLFWLTLPTLGEQALSYCVGLVDLWLAGHISAAATVAVGVGVYLNWFVLLAFSMVGVGAAALVSRAVGARDQPLAQTTLNQATWLALATGGVVAGVGVLIARPLAGFLTNNPETLALCTQFLQIVSLGYLIGSLNQIGAGVLRAAGDAVSPLRIMAVVNVVNLVVSSALVFGWLGPKLGVAGIAIGMATARTVGGLLMLALLLRGVRNMRLELVGLGPDWEIVRRILRVGIPASLDTGLMVVAQILFIKIISMTAFDPIAATHNFAAHVIAVQVEALSYLPALAIGTAAATVVGQSLGAGLPQRAALGGHIAAMQAAVYGVVCGVAFYFGASAVYGWMSEDPAVAAAGIPAFKLMVFVQPFLCMAIVYVNALRGAGDTRFTTVISLFGGVLVRVPVAYIGGIWLGGGLAGAWCGMFADNLVRFALGWGRFIHGGWKRTRV